MGELDIRDFPEERHAANISDIDPIRRAVHGMEDHLERLLKSTEVEENGTLRYFNWEGKLVEIDREKVRDLQLAVGRFAVEAVGEPKQHLDLVSELYFRAKAGNDDRELLKEAYGHLKSAPYDVLEASHVAIGADITRIFSIDSKDERMKQKKLKESRNYSNHLVEMREGKLNPTEALIAGKVYCRSAMFEEALEREERKEVTCKAVAFLDYASRMEPSYDSLFNLGKAQHWKAHNLLASAPRAKERLRRASRASFIRARGYQDSTVALEYISMLDGELHDGRSGDDYDSLEDSFS